MPALSPSCHALLANSIYAIAGFTMAESNSFFVNSPHFNMSFALLYIGQGNDLSHYDLERSSLIIGTLEVLSQFDLVNPGT